MRSVRLMRNAFINDRYCVSGDVVDIGEHTALAPHMRLLSSPSKAVITPHAAVVVHVHHATGEVDIDVNGVEMHIDHAALKIETD